MILDLLPLLGHDLAPLPLNGDELPAFLLQHSDRGDDFEHRHLHPCVLAYLGEDDLDDLSGFGPTAHQVEQPDPPIGHAEQPPTSASPLSRRLLQQQQLLATLPLHLRNGCVARGLPLGRGGRADVGRAKRPQRLHKRPAHLVVARPRAHRQLPSEALQELLPILGHVGGRSGLLPARLALHVLLHDIEGRGEHIGEVAAHGIETLQGEVNTGMLLELDSLHIAILPRGGGAHGRTEGGNATRAAQGGEAAPGSR
mmetsp:Transcript_63267/g.135972  ORF Transcript_63267/g.135972 Transcript_63267/m.135972 type:complete len:255 (-) Transcript_63267:990-1754(-)